jgi:hypothetical protein
VERKCVGEDDRRGGSGSGKALKENPGKRGILNRYLQFLAFIIISFL